MDPEQKPTETPTPTTETSAPVTPTPPAQKRNIPLKTVLIVIIVTVLIAGTAAYGAFQAGKNANSANAHVPATASKATEDSAVATPKTTQKIEGLQLDTTKNYGDKYADGTLPVGDNKYSTTSATKGKVYLCHANFVPSSQAGAQTRGPWFIGTDAWNINKKAHIRGSINWKQSITTTLSGDKRIITTNNLPDHSTGVFPVSSSDPAAKYDRNPNTISSQNFTYTLSGEPAYGTPQCMGGEVGIMLTGVALFNGFDAGGRDAGAWEVQDDCEGHPQGSGIYHYHTLSSCIKDVSVKTVIGFALDGFPITGPRVSDKNFLTTSDLDECHGLTSEVTLDGKPKTTYHYVMTEDFPYSASCFRASAIQSPGQHAGGQGQQPRP